MDWMPQLPTKFSKVVDYVVQNILFLECTPNDDAVRLRRDGLPAERHDRRDPCPDQYKFPRLMVSILDTTEHLRR